MTWAELFHALWQADWSDTDIAEAYGTNPERVRILFAVTVTKMLSEPLEDNG